MSKEEGRPWRGAPTADETGRSVPRQRAYRVRRWARRHLEALDGLPPTGGRPECARLHPGVCDYWGVCSGMRLGVASRAAAGARHAWRVSA